jgi:hypothetical protein
MDPKNSLGYNEKRHENTVKFWERHWSGATKICQETKITRKRNERTS